MNIRCFFLTFICWAAVAVRAPVEAAVAEGPVIITLTRSMCYGPCPAYRVTITGDGQVTYVGEHNVNAVGERRATIPRTDVERLLGRFDDIGFDQLRDAYRADLSDLPTYTVTIERNGRRKTVEDSGGLSAGMPRGVGDLQDEIDRVANTGQWVLLNGKAVRDKHR